MRRISAYRFSPHVMMGKSPFELFRRRIPNTKLCPGWMDCMKINYSLFKTEWKKREERLMCRRNQEYDERKKVCKINVNVGDVVKVKSPVSCMDGSKYSRPLKIVKLFRNAVKTSDGRIWNMNRVVPLKNLLEKEVVLSDGKDDVASESLTGFNGSKDE
ncbi:hypothetical protein NDU88_004324 [Pleurodeles waltl]|uniref:Uncharacterized protein n=1 Tax=Pleurodeles waltl TaxID=8319 RepID=A0AAV7VIZ2_PLEWA|nr:hypothetical protein NDU88_004324 [Pleurodeles waltl]